MKPSVEASVLSSLHPFNMPYTCCPSPTWLPCSLSICATTYTTWTCFLTTPALFYTWCLNLLSHRSLIFLIQETSGQRSRCLSGRVALSTTVADTPLFSGSLKHSLILWPRVALNSRNHSCLSFLSSGTAGSCHHLGSAIPVLAAWHCYFINLHS